MSFFYSGDEHGLFAIGAVVGTWIGLLYQFNTLGQALIPVLITGIVILAIVCILMDWLHIKKRLWLSIFVLSVIALFGLSVIQYGSFEKIRWKHRSVLAIVFFVCNLSVYTSIIFSVVTGIFERLLLTKRGFDVGKKPLKPENATEQKTTQ